MAAALLFGDLLNYAEPAMFNDYFRSRHLKRLFLLNKKNEIRPIIYIFCTGENILDSFPAACLDKE